MHAFLRNLKETCREFCSMPEFLDHMFDHLEDTNKHREDESLIKSGLNQGLLFKAAAKADHFTGHDDFSENQRLDHRHPVIRISDVMDS